MSAYLITGPNGSGKSTTGLELVRRGYYVIETDSEPGLSDWFDSETLKRIKTLPPYPFSKDWLAIHRWLWDATRLQEIIDKNTAKDIFFVGGAYNQKDLYALFDQHFTLSADDATSISRLQARGEGDRWKDGSPELVKMLDWNKKSRQHAIDSGGVVIDSARPIEAVVDDILRYCNPRTS